MLKSGKITFKENGLGKFFLVAMDVDIQFAREYRVADVYSATVQTQYNEFTKKVDMSYVNAIISDVMKVAPKGAIVVFESIISSNPIDSYVKPYVEATDSRLAKANQLVLAPKWIIPGNMFYELLHNDQT